MPRLRYLAIFRQCYSDRNHPDEAQVSGDRNEKVCRVRDEAEPGQFSGDGKKHSKSDQPSRKKPHKVACDGHSRSQQTESDRVNSSANRKQRKKIAFTSCAEADTSGTDSTQPAMPERINAIVAVKPPRRAMFVPAARTPMKRNRLTVVTAKIPKGTAEPNRKKLLTRIAVGLCAKNKRTCSAGAKGVT